MILLISKETLSQLPSLESISQDMFELFGCEDSYYVKRGFASRADYMKNVNEYRKNRKKSVTKELEIKENGTKWSSIVKVLMMLYFRTSE